VGHPGRLRFRAGRRVPARGPDPGSRVGAARDVWAVSAAMGEL